MAITTLDGALAGMQYPQEFMKVATPTLSNGKPHSLFYLAGVPPAAVAPSPGIGGAVLTSYGGQIPFTNPVSGNTYLARLQAQCTVPCSLLLLDRLWHNSGITITSTSEQAFTGSAQIPARDEAGTNAGNGVFGAVEVSGATGSGTPTLTLKYTNSAGATGHTATNVISTLATAPVGAFYPIGLAAGDRGIQKAESIQLSATWTSGTIHVVLYRVIARLELCAGFAPNAIDALTAGFTRLYDNSVPFIVIIPGATTPSNVSGHLIVTQG